MRRSLVVSAIVAAALAGALVAGCPEEPPRVAVRASPGIVDGGAALPRPPAVAPPALALVPKPRVVEACAGMMTIDASAAIASSDAGVGARLAGWLGLDPSRVVASGAPAAIRLVLEANGERARDPSRDPPRDTSDEAYTLDVGPAGATVRAKHPAGLFYGAQTLAELARSRPIGDAKPPPLPHVAPCVHVEDAPRFPFRAMHLDVARHYFSPEVVARYVDLLAFYRLNVFHWHLTDDQGFRIAIDAHPELTASGGGGSYTHDEARAIVAGAKERFVTVVPEIEMPGHVRAILASHPELSCTGARQPVPTTWGVFDDVLCAGNPKSLALMKDVLADVTAVFPSTLIHVGGDEVPKTRWKACPKCRARMEREHLGPEGLQGAFLKDVAADLGARGRRVMAWDEALEGGMPADGVAVAWTGEARGIVAARAGHDVVMAPHDKVYFNMWQSRTHDGQAAHEGYLPWTKVLAFDPSPSASASSPPPALDAATRAHFIGGEGALWTEWITTPEAIDAMVAPRIAALAEALWTGAASTSPEDFAARFTKTRPMLDASGVGYFVDPPVGLDDERVFLDAAKVAIAPTPLFADGVVRFTTDGSEPTASSPAFAPFEARATIDVAARLFLPNGRASATVRGRFEKETPLPMRNVDDPPLGWSYAYYEGDFHALPDRATLGAPHGIAAKSGGHVADLTADIPGARAERFAVTFDGYVIAPADAVYRFTARADDGVRVTVDDHRVLEDDGEHAARESWGEIALGAGPHAVRVDYFQGKGGKTLSLRVAPAPP